MAEGLLVFLEVCSGSDLKKTVDGQMNQSTAFRVRGKAYAVVLCPFAPLAGQTVSRSSVPGNSQKPKRAPNATGFTPALRIAVVSQNSLTCHISASQGTNPVLV
ncbi:unnamed protein product [Leuciscus chuanchicus]